MAEPTCHCLRDGKQIRLAAKDLVPGDIILVSEGERLPADSILIGGDALYVDESTLTGESSPGTKSFAVEPISRVFTEPGGDNSPYLYGGTIITRGSGVAEVVRTGAESSIGKIGTALSLIDPEPSPLQKTTGALIQRIGFIAFAFLVIVILAYGLIHKDWFEGAIAGITLAISLMPEEFPMVLAIFLALGAWRLAKHNVLVRRSSATETFGSVSMLCVDKTGTLTQNRMSISEVFVAQKKWNIKSNSGIVRSEIRDLIHTALLASAANPTDPMDQAVHNFSRELGISAVDSPIESYPVRPDRLAFIQKWWRGNEEIIAAKGAPEAIFKLTKSSEETCAYYRTKANEFAKQGLRVLAVAETAYSSPGSCALENSHFNISGLIAFEDPIREDVPAAITAAHNAGISISMITGDYPATALEIAKQAGIHTEAGAISGDIISASPKDSLPDLIRDKRVFARISPDSKLSIVEAFKSDGHIVAMTGDGVNDGPALAAAHIGIAMGQRGTDVARESAAIILLDDRFSSIISGISLGRRIFTNLRKALTYVMAIHVPIAGLALCPIIMGLPPLLLPAHVILMELVIDPTCALVFEGEAGEPDSMSAPPRAHHETLFGKQQIILGILQGSVIFTTVLSVYIFYLGIGSTEHQARGLAFTAMIIGNLTLALCTALPRQTSPFTSENKVFWIIASIAVSIVIASLYFPLFALLLRFEPPPSWIDLALVLILAIMSGSWLRMWIDLSSSSTDFHKTER
jgi:Ca2+-transporting ATPase